MMDQHSKKIVTPEAEARIALWCLTQHALTGYDTLMTAFGSATSALQQTSQTWKSHGVHDSHLKRLNSWQSAQQADMPHYKIFQQTLALLESGQIQLLLNDDLYFPTLLKQLPDPPPMLFIRGNVSALVEPQIAMVGTRKPTPSGSKIAQQYAQELASEGFWVTSGLAHGIDASAHLGALNQGAGRSIAVVGTGVMQCYPDANQYLYDRLLAEGGTIVSEFVAGTKPLAHHFPRRNRLVSGMSLGVLVVEAALKSGSLITAKLAVDQGRQVFAVPGHIFNEQAKGCHALIREGAVLVDEVIQIVNELNLPKRWHEQDQKTSIAPVVVALDLELALNDSVASVDSLTDNILTTLDAVHHQAEPNTARTAHTETTATATLTHDAVPEHLQQVWRKLDWVGIGVDDLLDQLMPMDIATLSGQLMELELFGYAVQLNGLYLRCRQA